MLGIYGAHLLLLAVTRAATGTRNAGLDQVQLDLQVQPAFLDVIVRNLRGLVGSKRPRCRGDSTRCHVDPALRTQRRLDAPPMLRRSWSLFVAASNDRPDLIPDGLWTRVRQIVTAPPFFTWARMTGVDPAVAIARSVTKRGRARTVVDRRRGPGGLDGRGGLDGDGGLDGRRRKGLPARQMPGGTLRSMNLGPGARTAFQDSRAAPQEPDLRQC